MPEDHDLAAMVRRRADLVTPMAVRVAATLRLADHIARGAHTAADLARAVDADPPALARLLRHLIAAGILTADASGCYELTELGEVLREDHPSRTRQLLDIEDALGRADLSFAALLHSVRTGEAAFPAQFGLPFWQDLAGDSERAASYDEQMGSDVSAWAPAIVSAIDWGPLGHIVDVGGGNGSLLKALLDAHPGLHGTVFDQPNTVEGARTQLAAAGLADRAEVTAGSFFEPLPSGAGGYLVTAIIHDWDDEPALAILRRCAEAAGPNGRVFVIEKIGVDGRSPGSEMDLRLLAYFGGCERSLDALIALTERSGLRVVAVHPAGAISIIELAASSSMPSSRSANKLIKAGHSLSPFMR